LQPFKSYDRTTEHDLVDEILADEELKEIKILQDVRSINEFEDEMIDGVAKSLQRPKRFRRDNSQSSSSEELSDNDALHDWLDDAQKAEISRLKASGADAVTVKAKMLEYFAALPPATKDEWTAKYKTQCASWVKKVDNRIPIKATSFNGTNMIRAPNFYSRINVSLSVIQYFQCLCTFT